jgi:hypothetical protein
VKLSTVGVENAKDAWSTPPHWPDTGPVKLIAAGPYCAMLTEVRQQHEDWLQPFGVYEPATRAKSEIAQ